MTPVSLKHKQNFFSIGFSAQAYTMAKDVKFRYRLYGFDDWTEVTGRRLRTIQMFPAGIMFFNYRQRTMKEFGMKK